MTDTYTLSDAAAVLHVRFLDYHLDLLLAALDLPHKATDAQIKSSVAEVLEIDVVKLKYFIVDRHHDSDITLRWR